jgi:malate dehydrogenase
MRTAVLRSIRRAVPAAAVGVRAMSSGKATARVTVVGAAGGIGQPLSLLLQHNPLIKHLSLYDVAPVTPGVAADLSHIDLGVSVSGHAGQDQLGAALQGADIVIVPAGVPRKPGMTRDDLFKINAGIVAGTAAAVAKHAPNAMLLIISNPVNSTVPICAEILKKAGVYDPRRLFGVTTLDVVRANTFVAENLKRDVRNVNVEVIGGHAGITIIPLLSRVANGKFSDADRDALTQRIMFGGDEVVKAKAGGGSATLSMAYAGAKFASLILSAKAGTPATACTYVQSSLVKGLSFFASPVTLGKNGVEKIGALPTLSAYEQGLLEKAVPELKSSIEKGVEFAAAYKL